MYAVIESGGKQYHVTPGETLVIERIEAKEGAVFTFDRVLLVANEGKSTIGSPLLQKASITADVVGHFRGEKKIAFKMRRRKGYHRTVGHRQEMTRIKISEIKF